MLVYTVWQIIPTLSLAMDEYLKKAHYYLHQLNHLLWKWCQWHLKHWFLFVLFRPSSCLQRVRKRLTCPTQRAMNSFSASSRKAWRIPHMRRQPITKWQRLVCQPPPFSLFSLADSTQQEFFTLQIIQTRYRVHYFTARFALFSCT